MLSYFRVTYRIKHSVFTKRTRVRELRRATLPVAQTRVLIEYKHKTVAHCDMDGPIRGNQRSINYYILLSVVYYPCPLRAFDSAVANAVQ